MCLYGLALVIVLCTAAPCCLRGNGKKSLRRPEDVAAEMQQTQLPPNSTVRVFNDNMTSPSAIFDADWQLPEEGRGIITFAACGKQGGLVIYLTDRPCSSSVADARGVAIVLDDQSDPPKSYVGDLPYFQLAGSASSTSMVNRGFRLNANEDSCQLYWISYDRGVVLVGQGAYAVPNDGANTEASSAAANIGSLIVRRGGAGESVSGVPPLDPDVKYFGFGALRRETDGILIKHIATYAAPESGREWHMEAPPTAVD